MANTQPIFTPADLEEGRAGRPQLCPISAGWPSPADNYVEDTIDLHRMAVPNPAATFFTRVIGESMIGAGILVENKKQRFNSYVVQSLA